MDIELYLGDMGFRVIGRVLRMNNVAVLKQIKVQGEWLQYCHNKNKV